MVMPSIFLICLITLKMDLWKKIGLGLLIALFLNSMLFSGTRGANPLLPAALVLFAILRYNRKVLVFSCFAALFLLFLIYVPTSNVNLYRFQSAFKPNNDQSYNLRKRNQKRIQPYILAHPMGGGLGSTGVWGKKYAPDSYLAQFPPDSGYIRVAVEDGWIGLLVFCTFMFIIIRTGIVNYYKIEDPELKVYCLAMTLIIFAYNLANFPQEALVQFPSSILFYFEAALINVTLRLDLNLRAEKKKTLQAASLAA
jgi:putative inorganic carbon (HCO3(-)) transporter